MATVTGLKLYAAFRNDIFIFYWKKQMTTFNHWDFVVSTTQKDITLEAQVDFETEDWKVYISEWWKNLNNPMRIVLDKKYLVKKDRKVILTKAQFQKLIYEYYPQPVEVDSLDKEVTVEDWFITEIDRHRIEYVAPYGEWKYLFRDFNSSPSEWRDDRYFIVTLEELQSWVVKKEDVLRYIFGNPDDSLYEIVLDDNTNTNEENI